MAAFVDLTYARGMPVNARGRGWGMMGAVWLVTVTACADDPPADDSSSASTGATMSSSTMPSTTTGAGGATSSSAATGGMGVGGAGAGAPTGPLYPLEVGTVWTYDVQLVGPSSFCNLGTQTSTITGDVNVAGPAVEKLSWCTGINSYWRPGPGDDEVQVYDDTQGWQTYLQGPLVDGAGWSYLGFSYTWREEGSVTVPAGTFDDCWSAVRSPTRYTTFCRGVGPVRSYDGAAEEAVLTNYAAP